MEICWNCKEREYHDYGEGPIRCPGCGELEKDDPAKAPKRAEVKAPVKRAQNNSKGKA